MKNKKTTAIIIATLAAVGLLGALLVYGFVAGGKRNDPHNVKATLSMWGLDKGSNYSDIIAAFREEYPNVTITYRAFTDPDVYDKTLIDALAAGKGPDIFGVSNGDARRKRDKIFPLPPSAYTVAQLRADFPDTVVRDFSYSGSVYALPLYVDTLALIYNRELLNEAGIAFPPETWETVQEIAPALTKYDGDAIAQSAIALGGAANIPNAKDIVSALWYQNGVSVVDEGYTKAVFGTESAVSPFDFYLQFAHPSSAVYAWNETLPAARDLFAAGKLAMLVDYDEGKDLVAARAPFVDLDVAELPQLDGAAKATYARYWGWTVARQSGYPNLAWEFIRTMATNRSYAENYLSRSGRPPALRVLIAKYAGDGERGVFARQALIGRAWQDPDGNQTTGIFADMIQSGKTAQSLLTVLRDGAAKVTNLMTARF